MSVSKAPVFAQLQINKLPTLPHVLLEILDACQSDTASFRQLSQLVSHDAVITSKVVAMANSAGYFRRQRITGIDQALLLIGTERTKTIAITAAVQQFFSKFNAANPSYLKEFWLRSLTCALLAKTLATLTSYSQPDQAYLVGLLHNIGDLVLRCNFPDEYAKVDSATNITPAGRLSQEESLLFTNHCEVGAWLLERWELGDFAAAAVRYHHEPLSLLVDAQHLVKLVYLASQLSGPGQQPDTLSLSAAEELFNLTPELVTELLQRLETETEEIALGLGIVLPDGKSQEAEIQQEDARKQVALAEQIRNISLGHTASEHLRQARNSAGEENILELLRAAEETIFMLFGYARLQVYQLDEEQSLQQIGMTVLEADTTSDEPLQISLQAGQSQFAAALLDNRIISSVDWGGSEDALPIVDRLALKRINCPFVVLVPMRLRKKNVGLMVLGAANQTDLGRSAKNLLRLFANDLAKNMARIERTVSRNTLDWDAEQLQAQLREIVHEANNPLAIIRNYLELLTAKLDDQPGLLPDIEIIKEEIDRVGSILLRLREVKQQETAADQMNINQEITDLTNLFEASLFATHNTACQLDLDDRLPPQRGQRSYLRQVLINLLKNAVEAMPEGGELHVSTRHKVNLNGRPYVEITVQDSGPGIPEEILTQLFEAGQSTKAGPHEGLGLSITKNLIQELKGSISCRNTRQGALFQILLPERAVTG